MYDLTARQVEILKALTEEYINTAEPVGSVTLEKKYDLGVSPATIRNEMGELDEKGYLRQPHTSAGRTPTSKALKLYINELMKPENLTVAEEVSLKERVWDSRFELDKLMRDAARTLAERTQTLSLAAVDEGALYYAGAGYILDMPEFYDIDITRNLLLMLDEFAHWEQLFSHMSKESKVSIILGPDLRDEMLRPYSFIFSQAEFPNGREGFVGVVGPKRLPYRRIIPQVSYCASLLEEIAAW